MNSKCDYGQQDFIVNLKFAKRVDLSVLTTHVQKVVTV